MSTLLTFYPPTFASTNRKNKHTMKRSLILLLALTFLNSISFSQGIGDKLKSLKGGNKELPEGAYATNNTKIYSWAQSKYTDAYFVMKDGENYTFNGARGMATKNQKIFTLRFDGELKTDFNDEVTAVYRLKSNASNGAFKTDKANGQRWEGKKRAIKTSDGVFILYSFTENRDHAIIGVPYAMSQDAPDHEPIVISDDPDKVSAWSGEKASELIKRYEGELDKMVASKITEKNGSIKLPEIGDLHEKHKNEATAALKKACVAKGVEYKTMVIESSDYNVLRNSVTGIVTGRQYWGHFVEYSSDRDEAPCRVSIFVMQQQHDGKDFTGKFYVKDIYKDRNLLVIPCENIE